MRFCPDCTRAMRRDTSSGAVVFVCHCGTQVPGEPKDSRVWGEVFGASEVVFLYDKLVKTAASDRTNQLVHRDCDSCGLDYQVRVRISASDGAEVFVYRCKCGAESKGSDDAAAGSAATGPTAP